MEQMISKSRFKPKALQYFREIQESGRELILTDHGKPVLKVIPYHDEPQVVFDELKNSVKRYDDPTEPVVVEDWEVLK